LKKGAEGKLLVPDVKLKISTSYVNISGSPASSYRNSNSCITQRTSKFSDSSMTGVTEEDELTFKSCGVESEPYLYLLPSPPYLSTSPARAWSYDNVLAYPCMAPPVRTEKRLET